VEAHPQVLRIPSQAGFAPSALLLACYEGASLPIVKYLYEKDPKTISIKNYFGELPFHYALKSDRSDSKGVVRFLVEKHFVADEMDQRQLLQWVCENYIGTDGRLIEDMVNKYPRALLMRGKDGTLPLHVRIRTSHGRSLTPEQEFAALIDANPFALLAHDKNGFTLSDYGYLCNVAKQQYLKEREHQIRLLVGTMRFALHGEAKRQLVPEPVEAHIWTFAVPDFVPFDIAKYVAYDCKVST
jgi:hypothetical protein